MGTQKSTIEKTFGKGDIKVEVVVAWLSFSENKLTGKKVDTLKTFVMLTRDDKHAFFLESTNPSACIEAANNMPELVKWVDADNPSASKVIEAIAYRQEIDGPVYRDYSDLG